MNLNKSKTRKRNLTKNLYKFMKIEKIKKKII